MCSFVGAGVGEGVARAAPRGSGSGWTVHLASATCSFDAGNPARMLARRARSPCRCGVTRGDSACYIDMCTYVRVCSAVPITSVY